MASRHIVRSGCSGGGKSTLLADLERRGFATVPEPGRRIVEEEQRSDGSALPWVNLSAFANRALQLAAQDRSRISGYDGWVFFDRGLGHEMTRGFNSVGCLFDADGNLEAK